MNEKAKNIPTGSNGLFVYPFWTAHPVLCPNDKSAIIGWTDSHKKEHLYKAILESIDYALRDGLYVIEKDTKQKINEIYIVGGGNKSDVAMQLTGDIFNIPTKRLQTHKVCAIGAAINAGMAINMFHHEEEAVKNVTKVLEAFYPIKENVKIYNDIFNNVYKKIYNNGCDIFKTLSKY